MRRRQQDWLGTPTGYHVGRPAERPPASPLWKRWRISYAAKLEDFRQRAEALVALATAEGRKHPVLER